MNVDKELHKQAHRNLRGTDPSIAKYMQVLEREVCHLEKLNAQLSQDVKALQQQQAS